MNNLWIILKKELTRVFKDFRMLFTTILMPGLLIFLIYSAMGNFSSSSSEQVIEAKVSIVNNFDTFNNLFENNAIKQQIIVTFNEIEEKDIASAKEELLNGDIDYIIVFEEDFEQKTLNKDGPRPEVLTYYNPSISNSKDTNTIMSYMFSSLEETYQKILYGDTIAFTSNIGSKDSMIYKENELMGQTLAMLFPFLIVTFLFAGAMSIGAESIAGEKERGTIATLLVTPTKRSHIALGKIFSLAIISILSAFSSFIGIILSLPNILGLDVGALNIYSFADYLNMLIVLIVTTLVIISVIAVISCFAKNVKEASLYVTPAYLVFMMVGMISMFTGESKISTPFYLIPIFNSTQMLSSILSFDFNITNFVITIVSNLIVTLLLVFALTKMFDNEKIMFSK